MRLTEAEAKEILAGHGIAVPRSRPAATGPDARAAAELLGGGRVVVKAQIRSGGRGKAGGVVLVDNPRQAGSEAGRLLGSTLNGETVTAVLIEEAVIAAEEHYVSVTVDPTTRCPILMQSDQGGVDVESMTDQVRTTALDPVDPSSSVGSEGPVARAVVDVFQSCDALTVEVNPLAVTPEGRLVALDAKIELDDAARFRQEDLHDRYRHPPGQSGSERERRAADLGLRLIELGGDVAVLANGAGLTMATMDAIVAAGGRPANFLEIGGDAYTKATPALGLVLEQPGVRSLLVNFCGAFARCDVMVEGVVAAWEHVTPELPVAFSIAGTGRDEAVELLRDRLAIDPYPSMAAAVRAAVDAARRSDRTP